MQVLQITRGWAAPETADAAAHARELAEKSLNLAQLVVHVFGMWAAVITAGDLTSAGAFADQILDLAQREGSPANLGLAYVGQVTTCYYRGDLSGAEKHFALGAPFYDAARRKSPGVVAGRLGNGSHVAWLLGRADTARDRIREATAGATDLKSAFAVAYVQFLAAALQLFLNVPEQAETSASQAVTLSDEHGFQQYSASSRIVLGRAQAGLGRIGEGVELIREGLSLMAEGHSRIAITQFLCWLAEAQALNGSTSDALVTIDEALEANPEELAWRPEAIRVRGELRLKLSEIDGAEADFRGAIALAKKINAKAWELRAAVSLARVLKARRDLAEARDLIAPLYASFTEGLETHDLRDAMALLDELNE